MLLLFPQQIPFGVFIVQMLFAPWLCGQGGRLRCPLFQVYLALLSCSSHESFISLGLTATQFPGICGALAGWKLLSRNFSHLFFFLFLLSPVFYWFLQRIIPPMSPCWFSWVCGAESTDVSDTLDVGLHETSHLKIFFITSEAVYLCTVEG